MVKLKALASLELITSYLQEAPTCARCELLCGLPDFTSESVLELLSPIVVISKECFGTLVGDAEAPKLLIFRRYR